MLPCRVVPSGKRFITRLLCAKTENERRRHRKARMVFFIGDLMFFIRDISIEKGTKKLFLGFEFKIDLINERLCLTKNLETGYLLT